MAGKSIGFVCVRALALWFCHVFLVLRLLGGRVVAWCGIVVGSDVMQVVLCDGRDHGGGGWRRAWCQASADGVCRVLAGGAGWGWVL